MRKKHEGCVWEHGKKYYACYSIKNKLYRRPFNTHAEATEFLYDFTAKKAKGRVINAHGLTVGELFDLVLANLKLKKRRSIGDVVNLESGYI